LRNIPDYTKNFQLIPVENPRTVLSQINPGATLTAFNGSVATTIDGTTQFTTSINYILNSTYRFSWTGGTNPTLKTNRNLTLSVASVMVAVNAVI